MWKQPAECTVKAASGWTWPWLESHSLDNDTFSWSGRQAASCWLCTSPREHGSRERQGKRIETVTQKLHGANLILEAHLDFPLSGQEPLPSSEY